MGRFGIDRPATVSVIGMLLVACLGPSQAEARTVSLELTGEHRPVRIRISNPQRTIQITPKMKTILVSVENNSTIAAYYVDGGNAELGPVAYSLRFEVIGEGLTINFGRILRSGCDRNYIDGFRNTSNDPDTIIRNVIDFRYFSMNCKTDELKAKSIIRYCSNIFALDSQSQFGLISDFIPENTVNSLNSKNCVAKVKSALS
jgi:hypothetical protein